MALRGRPRSSYEHHHVTSIALDKEAYLAIRRLQIDRISRDEPEPTLRDLVVEGIALLLEKYGIEQMKVTALSEAVSKSISIEKGKKPRKERSQLGTSDAHEQQGC